MTPTEIINRVDFHLTNIEWTNEIRNHALRLTSGNYKLELDFSYTLNANDELTIFEGLTDEIGIIANGKYLDCVNELETTEMLIIAFDKIQEANTQFKVYFDSTKSYINY